MSAVYQLPEPNEFETEPTSTRVVGVNGLPLPRSASPKPCWYTV